MILHFCLILTKKCIILFQIQWGFRAHVHEEVEDTQVWFERVLVAVNLIVFASVGAFQEVILLVEGYTLVLFCSYERDIKFEEFEAFGYESLVQIEQIFPFLLVDRAEIVLKVFKERRVAITCLECEPVLMAPVELVAQAYILHKALPLVGEVALVDRYGKSQFAVGRIDVTAIAQSLLLVILVDLNSNWFATFESSEPTYWGKIITR